MATRKRKLGKTFSAAAREELERIRKRNGGVLHPAIVVKAAKSKRSRLHGYFEWDDTRAAQQYRLQQAADLIRVTVTILPGDSRPIRAYVSLTTDRMPGGGIYRATVDVLSDDDQRAQLLLDALAELEAFSAKYAHLEELAEVFAAAARARTTAAAKKKKGKAKAGKGKKKIKRKKKTKRRARHAPASV